MSGDYTGSGSFEAAGSFVVDEPDTIYTVNCPEESADAVCDVSDDTQDKCGTISVYQDDGDGNTDLKNMCGDLTYTVGLKSINHEKGTPHFALLAVLDEANETNMECPNMILFEGYDKKTKMTVQNAVDGFDKDIHIFGKIALSALLDGEEQANAISDDEYDKSTNNCVHYAVEMLKNIGFLVETQEFADFLVNQLMVNPKTSGFFASYLEIGGPIRDGIRRNLVTNSDKLKAYLIEITYSQLGLN